MGARGKILVIEDELLLQQAYAQILESKGYHVAVANDGMEGLQQLENDEPNLILLDILMPRMDGLEFLRNAHMKLKHPRTKVIAFSNLSKTAKIKEMLELGASDHVLKSSISPSQLVKMVADLLND